MATASRKLQETFADRLRADLTISSSLRTWLRGDWALLFSNPNDFEFDDFEADRWIVVLRQSFAASGVRPLGLATRTPSRPARWVTETGGSYARVSIEERQWSLNVFELNAGTLRHEIQRSSSRFVMVIDESLRLRRTFIYTARDHLPSPLDFAAVASKLRRNLRPVTFGSTG